MTKKFTQILFYSIFASAVFLPFSVSAQFTGKPVGGRFLPGVFDIFTPNVLCRSLTVTVVGPNPGTFTWMPISIYDYFYMTPFHVGNSMLGLSGPMVASCAPLYMLGSSIAP